MTTTILDVTQKIADFQRIQIKKALDSINQLGIVPLGKINTQSYTPNFVLGGEETQKNVCVNYLDLTACSSSVTEEDAIHEAIWEEYTGVFGISMERTFPFSFPNNNFLFAQETESRLSTNIVFVLDPPTKKGVPTPVTEGAGATMNVYYEPLVAGAAPFNHDGFSRARERSLDLAPKKTISQVTEIKTNHTFTKQEIIAVLVPPMLHDHFSKELNEYFPGKVIKVPYTQGAKAVNKFPDILRIMHKEAIAPGQIALTVPDYERTLKQMAKHYKKFSLHAMRLHTVFDFTPRYIHNLSRSANLLQKANACVLKENANGSGWVLMHQAKISDSKGRALMPLLSSRFDNVALKKELLAAKDEMQSTRILTDGKAAEKVHFLKKGIESLSEVDAIHIDYDRLIQIPELLSQSQILLLSYPAHCKNNMNVKLLEQKGREVIERQSEAKTSQEDIQKKMREEKQREEAAKVIQACARRHLSKKLLGDYRVALNNYKAAQASLHTAGQGLTAITEKLKRRCAGPTYTSQPSS
ncbi:MAG TPA: hypothetical protein VNK03_03765 [Gammaproteobacteria bacterium]|nr:hypothetical protein [Gammaproteobacteria bacterium]